MVSFWLGSSRQPSVCNINQHLKHFLDLLQSVFDPLNSSYECFLASSLFYEHNAFLFLFICLLFGFPEEFLGQGSGLSHSFNLSQNCGNARSLNHCTGPGIEPASWCYRDATDPIAPQWELLSPVHFLLDGGRCVAQGSPPRKGGGWGET